MTSSPSLPSVWAICDTKAPEEASNRSSLDTPPSPSIFSATNSWPESRLNAVAPLSLPGSGTSSSAGGGPLAGTSVICERKGWITAPCAGETPPAATPRQPAAMPLSRHNRARVTNRPPAIIPSLHRQPPQPTRTRPHSGAISRIGLSVATRQHSLCGTARLFTPCVIRLSAIPLIGSVSELRLYWGEAGCLIPATAAAHTHPTKKAQGSNQARNTSPHHSPPPSPQTHEPLTRASL